MRGYAMIYRLKAGKTKQLVSKDKVPSLVRAARMFEFKNIQDVLEANKLSSLIFDEWFNLNEKYKRKLYKGNSISKKVYAQYEAEEQIIIGLAAFLNEKMISFVEKLLSSGEKK
jgi:hypothetical protein